MNFQTAELEDQDCTYSAAPAAALV